MKLQDMFKLNGKTALVTGGGRGIGRFIATGLAEAGADVIVTSRKMKNLEATAQELAQSQVDLQAATAARQAQERANEDLKAKLAARPRPEPRPVLTVSAKQEELRARGVNSPLACRLPPLVGRSLPLVGRCWQFVQLVCNDVQTG